jgi:enamine deaminase RidA (YjgF/YER057c/UK114 family)
MSSRINISSGAPWEETVGYSRAVRVGNVVEVSGTVAAEADGSVVGEDDAYAQTLFVLRKIEAALLKAGATLEQVVRTRMFVTDISRFSEYGRAHGEVFGAIRPATAIYEVSALVAPAFLVEIEATAIIE